MESQIVNWELELFDTQPATVGGLDKEFIFAGRIDDKLCSWAAIQALIESQDTGSDDSSIIKVVGLFDDEEIGSLLRQGARGNFLPQALERAVGSLAGDKVTSDLMGRTYANSFLVSSDVTHAVNPNFLDSYLANHSPHLNVGVVVSADSNGHMTTDSVSTALFKRCADTVGAKLQVFQIRNDSRSVSPFVRRTRRGRDQVLPSRASNDADRGPIRFVATERPRAAWSCQTYLPEDPINAHELTLRPGRYRGTHAQLHDRHEGHRRRYPAIEHAQYVRRRKRS